MNRRPACPIGASGSTSRIPWSLRPTGSGGSGFRGARPGLDLGPQLSPARAIESLFGAFYVPLFCSLVLFDSSVIPIHANAVIRDGRAVLLTGLSRSGKTTLTGLLDARPDYRVLTDDQALLRLRDGRWQVFASPRNWAFHRYFLPRAEDPRKGYPLGAIYVLGHGATNKIEPVTPNSFFRILLDQTFPRLYDALRQDAYFDLLESLSGDFSPSLFKFVPDASAADFLESELRSAH